MTGPAGCGVPLAARSPVRTARLARPAADIRTRPQAGFTLVELLIALAIFAVITALSYRSLAALLDAREALEKDSRKWRDIALFVGRFERDVAAVVPRLSAGPSGTALSPVSSLLDLGGATARGLALTRSGALLNQNTLAAPQRIAYRFLDGKVERLAWNAADAAPRSEPVATPVLEAVRSLEFRFFVADEWRPEFGLPGSGVALPAAVEVAVTLDSGERVTRLVALPR
jgi:general secretion pathway protein J